MLTKKSPSNATKQRSTSNSTRKTTSKKSTQPAKNARTRIVVRYDVGFNNALYIRGNGPHHLNWERGLPLRNLRADEWVWETDAKFNNGEFKILINDHTFEVGPNRSLKHGSEIEFTPHF